MEFWKKIKEFKDYEISNQGSVKSLKFNKQKILTGRKTTKGYLKVLLLSEEKKFNFFVHRLVAQEFLPNPNNLTQVNHIDGNKLNNSVENLEWCDGFHNMNHSFKNNTHKTKYSEDKIKEILKYKNSGFSSTVISKLVGVNRRYVSGVLSGKFRNKITNINEQC
jgi:hypothetical protein